MSLVKKITIIITSVFLLAAAIFGAYFVANKTSSAAFDIERNKLEEKINNNTTTGYVLKQNIPANVAITEDLCEKQNVLCYAKNTVFTSSDFGKISAIPLQQGTLLYQHHVYANDDLVKISAFSGNSIPILPSLKTGDYIDIYIVFNGTSYLVAKQLQVNSIEDNLVLCRMTDEQIVYLNSALSDKNTYENTRLYMAIRENKYITSETEKEYVPKELVLENLGRPELIAYRQKQMENLTEKIKEKDNENQSLWE